jgi:hypothetical protein
MRLLWSFLALTALTATALAQTTLYETSFENPPFTAGQPAPTNDGWENGSGGGVSHVVTADLAYTGSQSLKWDNSGTNNSFYSIRRVLNWQPTDPDKLVVKVRVYITAGTGADRLYGVYLTGSDTGTLGSTILGVTIAGDGKIRVGTTWGATYSSSAWLAQAPAGTYENRWLQVEMTCDRGSGQATIKVSGFADNAEYTANLTPSTEPRNINLGTDYVTTTARNGIGYFDDLSITAEAGTPFDGWDETANGGGDAGDLPETAQSTGSDPITKIRGTIGGANDVDVYAIYISDPSTFSATTIGGTSLDTALWLFDENGKGVVHNEDDPNASTGFQSRIDNRTFCITQPGRYYLAVSLFGRRAAGCSEGLIWATTPARAVRCPDGPESTSRVGGWSGSSSSTGRYIIFLTGVSGATAGDPADCPPFDGWDETDNGGGDAGDLPETAQSTGSDPITKIRGTIGAANDVDVYAIYISDPSTFSATTTGGTSLDTALWLFDENGKGVVHNEDDPNASTGFQSRIDNRTFCITQPGRYYLAVSLSGRRAAGCGDGLIWATTPARAVRCPDGPESTSRVGGWSGTSSSTGRYIIFLTGVSGASAGDPADCPPPDPWDEQFYGGGDAGDLPATAQLVTLPDQTPCQSPVTRVRGDNDASDVDMYVICITDPANFVASTVGTTTWDTQLWLFRCDGTGVVFNDDNPDTGGGTQSRIDNRANCIQQGGIYLLAISRYNRDAVDAQNQLLWNNTPLDTVRCPDGPGAANPIAGWTNTPLAGGRYVISLQGAYFVSDQGCEGGPGQCEGDATGDGRVDDADLLVVLFNFGCFGFCGPADIDRNGTVDDADLLIVLFNFGCGS